MIKRLSLLALGMAAMSFAQPAFAWQDEYPTVKFGVMSLENQGGALTRYEGLKQHMAEKLEIETVELFLANDYAGVVQALSAGQIQMALVGASAYAAAYIDCDGCVEPDRKSVVEGKSVSVRGDLGGRRIHTKNKQSISDVKKKSKMY